jgi:hypothetical protein
MFSLAGPLTIGMMFVAKPVADSRNAGGAGPVQLERSGQGEANSRLRRLQQQVLTPLGVSFNLGG